MNGAAVQILSAKRTYRAPTGHIAPQAYRVPKGHIATESPDGALRYIG